MALAELTFTTNDVGVPLAERALTAALERQAQRIVPPGPGRSLVHLSEVELGTGRPDSILVVLSSAGLRARLRAGLRLPTAAHARVLEAVRSGKPSGYSSSHVNQLANSLRDRGWLTRRGSVRSVPNLVDRSLVVEAKMSDWRTGVGQLSKARWAGHAAALLMPPETQHRVSRTTLRHNRLGLLIADERGVSQQVRPPTVALRWMADLWLTELAMRSIEAGDS